MGPLKREERQPDQVFDADEKLYRRVSPNCLGPQGELQASGVRFENDIKKSPSVVRSKYGSSTDAVHRDCANGRDVSKYSVFYLIVGELLKQVESKEDKQLYDFYPAHTPEDDCFAHTVIACRKHDGPLDAYDMPSKDVINKLKAQFVAAFAKNKVEVQSQDA